MNSRLVSPPALVWTGWAAALWPGPRRTTVTGQRIDRPGRRIVLPQLSPVDEQGSRSSFHGRHHFPLDKVNFHASDFLELLCGPSGRFDVRSGRLRQACDDSSRDTGRRYARRWK